MSLFLEKAREAALILITELYHDTSASILSINEIPFAGANSFIAKSFGPKELGHLVFQFTWKSKDKSGTEKIKLKVSKSGAVSAGAINMYRSVDLVLGTQMEKLKHNVFDNHNHREANLLALDDLVLKKYTPKFLLNWYDPETGITGFATEFLSNTIMMDSVGKEHLWTPAFINSVLDGFAEIHASFLGRTISIPASCHINDFFAPDKEETLNWYWHKAEAAARLNPQIFTQERMKCLKEGLRMLGHFMHAIPKTDLTLSHGNSGIRNICLRTTGNGTKLCAYDWEFAAAQVPMRDIVEFLTSTLTGEIDLVQRDIYINNYMELFQFHTNTKVDREKFNAYSEFSMMFYFFQTVLNLCVRKEALRPPNLSVLIENCFRIFEKNKKNKIAA